MSSMKRCIVTALWLAAAGCAYDWPSLPGDGGWPDLPAGDAPAGDAPSGDVPAGEAGEAGGADAPEDGGGPDAGDTCAPGPDACPPGKVCDVACGESLGVCVEQPGRCPNEPAIECDCGGRAYWNGCVRRAAGAPRDPMSSCGLPGTCVLPADCPAGATCDVRACGVAVGTCVRAPGECGAELAPVCGCNGVTYDSDCLRLRADQALDHAGGCAPPPPACAGGAGGPCDGGFCDVRGCSGASPTCRSGAPDCTPRLECGCDGRTYADECERLDAHVALAHAGACVRDCAGDPTACEPGDLCDVRGCGDGRTGTCVPDPRVCIGVGAVCGCDGNTYLNDCERLRAGTGLAFTGACAFEESCTTEGECLFDRVCDLRSCRSGSTGRCTERPRRCPDIRMPVCGCDGNTYGNDCERLRAGVALGYEGECTGTGGT